MDTFEHDFHSLFAQLGLPNKDQDIAAFIRSHRNLEETMPLDRAPFWSPAQAQFLREAIAEDADWAELVDQLDASLRH